MKTILHLLKQLRTYYPHLSNFDIIIAALEELLAQNRRMKMPNKLNESQEIRIRFDGPPSHESGRFIEVENEEGASLNFGEWVEDVDGTWLLVFPNPYILLETLKTISE